MADLDQTPEARLLDLWRRRSTLAEGEWHELYALVGATLANQCTSLIAQLGGTREEYIQDFFEDKVLLPEHRDQVLHHRGALIFYYQRYLLSRLRDPYFSHRLVPAEDDEAREIPDREPAHMDGLDIQQQLSDWLAHALASPESPAAATDTQTTRSLVKDFLGIDPARAVRAATDFLHGRGDWSHLSADSAWIRLYLRCHFCPDDEEQTAVALSTLARRHGIPSYHARAVKLGTTVPKQQDAALESFRQSYRGQWLASLGIAVAPEYQLEMALALKILCLAALKEQEAC